jgi:hypothetical protein
MGLIRQLVAYAPGSFTCPLCPLNHQGSKRLECITKPRVSRRD